MGHTVATSPFRFALCAYGKAERESDDARCEEKADRGTKHCVKQSTKDHNDPKKPPCHEKAALAP